MWYSYKDKFSVSGALPQTPDHEVLPPDPAGGTAPDPTSLFLQTYGVWIKHCFAPKHFPCNTRLYSMRPCSPPQSLCLHWAIFSYFRSHWSWTCSMLSTRGPCTDPLHAPAHLLHNTHRPNGFSPSSRPYDRTNSPKAMGKLEHIMITLCTGHSVTHWNSTAIR